MFSIAPLPVSLPSFGDRPLNYELILIKQLLTLVHLAESVYGAFSFLVLPFQQPPVTWQGDAIGCHQTVITSALRVGYESIWALTAQK